MPNESRGFLHPLQRIRFWYALILLVCGIFLIRLFYLQIIRYDHYQQAALNNQLDQYSIPAARGAIYAYSGGQRVPIVLNETKYTLFADPKQVVDPGQTAKAVQSVINGQADEYEALMKVDSRYSVLAKKLDKNQQKALAELKLKGIYLRETIYRAYPQGTLAAQLLGFVDDEGAGRYGLEQALDEQLKGAPGMLRAITDARGVPLAANEENIAEQPKDGTDMVLTVDIGMQRQLEDILKAGVKRAIAPSGGAVILDIKTGAIKAMANYPTYNPAAFFDVSTKNVGVFENKIASAPLEIGSVMKPLTMAAALDQGVVSPGSSYYDPGMFRIDGATVRNVVEAGGAGQRTMRDILQQSLNTGATWLLMQMGGGEINQRGREAWHEYMTNHYRFGKPTGVQQAAEAAGTVPSPTEGFGLNIQYANTAFGQGMTATPLQVAAALASVINGGTYHKPYLVDKTVGVDGVEVAIKPEVLREKVVKPEVGRQVQSMMEYVFSRNHAVYGMPVLRSDYGIGSKTGTAQIAKPGGGYYDDRENGMFMGFVGGKSPQYVVVVRVDTPKIAGYAGSKAAGPIFVETVNMLIDNFGVIPR